MTHPTGEQFELETTTSTGDVRATVTAVAAGLRTLTINGIDLVPPFGEERTPPSGAGIVLVPWPNRIRDGVWTHGETTHQLAITEPPRNTAIHGLLRYTEYTPSTATATRSRSPRPSTRSSATRSSCAPPCATSSCPTG
ncbi:hypothetical protein [Agromyces marinus]|uniref:hypothetical protein n=1 Tax=Agromyces marinus TaxID=1389020 RepID=UPI003305854E